MALRMDVPLSSACDLCVVTWRRAAAIKESVALRRVLSLAMYCVCNVWL